MKSQKENRRHVAVVFAGCGARDGTEITEAVSLLIALAQENYEVSCFAPDKDQFHTLNHRTGKEEGASRNMLVEAARIARGNIRPLIQLQQQDFDALLFTGGFGVAKNLCNFAWAGAEAELSFDIRDTILNFILAKKPLGAMCISPILLALAAREVGLIGAKLTLGDGSAKDNITAIESWRAKHVPCKSGQACIDEKNRFVSVPAYMITTATPADIYSCAKAMVSGITQLLT